MPCVILYTTVIFGVEISLSKEKIDRSEAILRKKRNTKKGLQMRNKILIYLYELPNERVSTIQIAESIGLSYHIVNYHLKSMFDEEVVVKSLIARKSFWKITGYGQQTIKKWLENNNQ